MLVGPLQFGGLPRDHSCWHRHSSPKWKLWRSEIGAGSKLWPFEAVLSFNHFYKGKLGKTGRLLLWKCAWGSCMNKPMDKSTIMDVPDKHNRRQQGDGLTRRCTRRRFFCTSQRPGGDHKGTNKDKPKGEPLTGDSFNASKTILTNWGSSMSMLVGPLQFGGLPRDHSCWHRHSSPKWELWRSEIGAGRSCDLLKLFLTISIKGN